MTPTPEQSDIIAFAQTSPRNLIVEALAGTGKTSTIEMICHAIGGIPILYLAFNKRIVEEAVKRMPSHVECKTQNSLGHRVWAAATGKRLIVAPGKMRDILKTLIADLSPRARDDAWENFSDTIRWLGRAKRDGYVPERWLGPCPGAQWRDYSQFCARYGERPDDRTLFESALLRSIAMAYEGGIDYDDQIYMPIVFGGPWPKFPLVIIDEAQDLNELQHEMLSKLTVKRLIAVGDPWQSIYAFRGAISNGMRALVQRFDAAVLPLSVTFRVPKCGVQRAQDRVPHYRFHPNNPQGEIIRHDKWGPEDVPREAAIICRNNAPLLALAFRLLRSGRPIKLVGMDIGPGLIRILKKLGSGTLSGYALGVAIRVWEERELARGRGHASTADRAECLLALCDNRPSLTDAIIATESLFKSEGPIQLMSGHKSKGLEFDHVIHLDPWRIPGERAILGTEEYEQELNVKYVIETRFKQTLTLVNLEEWEA